VAGRVPAGAESGGTHGHATTSSNNNSNRRLQMMGASARFLTDVIRMGDNNSAMPSRTSRQGPDRVAGPNQRSLEHIRQGLLTMHTMLSVMDDPERNEEARAGQAQARSQVDDGEEKEEMTSLTVEPVALTHRSLQERDFFVGQWLDVKDTVNQWLEATVMDINERERLVKIHYNGWPIRWVSFAL